MTLPKRGDSQALLIIALALFADLLFWALALALPLGGLAGMIYEVFQLERAITAAEMAKLIALFVVSASLCVGAGFLCRLASRGLLTGSRIAYLSCAVVLFFFGFFNFAGGLLLRDQLQGQFGEAVGIGIMTMSISVLVGMIGIGEKAIGGRTEDGQPVA